MHLWTAYFFIVQTLKYVNRAQIHSFLHYIPFRFFCLCKYRAAFWMGITFIKMFWPSSQLISLCNACYLTSVQLISAFSSGSLNLLRATFEFWHEVKRSHILSQQHAELCGQNAKRGKRTNKRELWNYRTNSTWWE